MKFYVDFKDLDAEDMPSNISNTYKLQVRSCNAGSDIRVELKSLADYTKQVRKEVAEEIRYSLLDFSHNYWKVFKQNGKQYMTDDDLEECFDFILEKLGEEE